ncbi:MAG: hypothetical protein LV477_06965 [Candidatus Nitrosotalea sp.]|nr:hypothetical protein [Candidatus Nitrosotalea sp.]
METQSKNNETNPELPILKKGIFYAILDDPAFIIMEDKTKRGLTVQERSLDEKYDVNSDKGMIYDMDGIGHKVGIRWYFPKDKYGFDTVLEHATEMEQRYRKIREETCPDY